MNIVERIYPGFQWAEPLKGSRELEVEQVGSDLHISGLVPRYQVQDAPTDLVRHFEKTPRSRPIGQQRVGKEPPDIRFANATSDDELISFVRRFGPVVAKVVQDTRLSAELGEPRLPARLIAHQDLEELRSEQLIYRSALGLVMQLNERKFEYDVAQQQIKTIAANIGDWPRQWEREKSRRRAEPTWELSAQSLKRIQQRSSGRPDQLLPATLDARIVICELLNSFRSMIFPNPLEMHSSIKFGVRPLLYSLLRRQFLHPRGFAVCANTQCRNFFNIERAGQQFCDEVCSLQHRQRVYWERRGKKLRRARTKEQGKTKE
jgi:hypothetical protein